VVLLYIETNFLMSIATGREPSASLLLQEKPHSLQLVIPSICYMEAFSVWEDEVTRHNSFKQRLEIQIREAERDLTSPNAGSLYLNLRQAKIDYENRLDDITFRLNQAIKKLSQEAEMIDLTPEIVQESLNNPLITKDPTDNLILHCILYHAKTRPDDVKVFLSGNIKEFRQLLEVQDALQAAGVVKYFSHTENFLGWLQSQ
jgi:hypothetical protein